MNDLIFIQVVPHDLYFQWQVEVQIVNFRKFGISDKMQICVWYPKNSKELSRWEVIQKKYPEVKFFFYEDDGVQLGIYIPQLRPHTLKKHFAQYPELKDKVLFYHDSDIIFNYLPDFEELIKGDICWQSNTSGYLDYQYILRKEKEGNIPNNEAVKELCKIGDITPELFESYSGKTGGAQTILRGIDSDFWKDVERMCLEIRWKFFHGSIDSINRRYFKDESSGFQSWCADMWALNFAQWKRGMVTDVTDKLDFSWATDSLGTFNKKPIFHNAGATPDKSEIFYKGAYINESPIGKNLNLPPADSASRKYVEAILEVNNLQAK